jgi:hypothetical protein
MASGNRYFDKSGLAGVCFLANALSGGGDAEQSFPQSDAEDLSRGAKFVPGEVTKARRAGKKVTFEVSCKSSTCCWYWLMPDGSKIYHFEQDHFERLRHEHGGTCPECGNTHIIGDTITA